LSWGERWCFGDNLGHVFGQLLGGVVAAHIDGMFGAGGVLRPPAPVPFGTGDLGSAGG